MHVYDRTEPGLKSQLVEAMGAQYIWAEKRRLDHKLADEIGPIDIIFEATGYSPLAFDAMVLRVAPVLIGEQDVEEARIDIGARRRQSPAALRRGVGPQQPPVAVDHHGGIGKPLAARCRAEGDDPAGGGSNADDDKR